MGFGVNAVSPGVIEQRQTIRRHMTILREQHPLGRVGLISDVVDGVLLSETAPFIAGEVLHVDSGQIAGS